VTYGHDAIGNLTAVSGPAGSAAYGYDDPSDRHRLTSLDEGEGEIVNVYDDKGRVTRQTRGNSVTDFQYLSSLHKTKVTTTVKDLSGAVINTEARTVEFDTNGQVTKDTDALGNVTIYTRDGFSITRREYWENTGTAEAPELVLKNAAVYDNIAESEGPGVKSTSSSSSGGDYISPTSVTMDVTEAADTAMARTTTYRYGLLFYEVETETTKSVVDPAVDKITIYDYDDANASLLSIEEKGLLGDGTPVLKDPQRSPLPSCPRCDKSHLHGTSGIKIETVCARMQRLHALTST
jgi:YD repeat-containing protein